VAFFDEFAAQRLIDGDLHHVIRRLPSIHMLLSNGFTYRGEVRYGGLSCQDPSWPQ
jgi:hypothetical protein